MRKILMSGAMLLSVLSCKPPTIKKPVEMFIISLEFEEAGVGKKNLDITDKPKKVGEWVKEIEFVSLDQIPKDLMCFPLSVWLTKIKPTLKEGAQFYRDSK